MRLANSCQAAAVDMEGVDLTALREAFDRDGVIVIPGFASDCELPPCLAQALTCVVSAAHVRMLAFSLSLSLSLFVRRHARKGIAVVKQMQKQRE